MTDDRPTYTAKDVINYRDKHGVWLCEAHEILRARLKKYDLDKLVELFDSHLPLIEDENAKICLSTIFKYIKLRG